MNQNKALALVMDLFNAGVINAEENKRAELYLNLTSQNLTSYQEVIDWLIINRAVKRDRQDQVRAAFNGANLNPIPTHTAPEAKTTSAAAVNGDSAESPTARIQAAENGAHQTAAWPTPQTNHQDTSSIEAIYQYNLQQLDKLANEQPTFMANKQSAKDNLRHCPYLFICLDELEEWILSGYSIPIDANDPDDLIDAVTAQQLYSLWQERLISEYDYNACYDILISDTDITLPFKSTAALFDYLIQKLAQYGCLHHGLTDPDAIKNYNHNVLLLQQLGEQKALSNHQINTLWQRLHSEPNLYFQNPQQLLEWFESHYSTLTAAQQQAAKKSRKGCLTLIVILFLIYPITSIIIDAIKDRNPRPSPIAITRENAMAAELKNRSTDNGSNRILQNEYERVIAQQLDLLDKMSKHNPSYPSVNDLFVDITLSGKCQTQPGHNVTECPFTVYYHDRWPDKNNIVNYQIKVKFISRNNRLMLASINEFMEALLQGANNAMEKEDRL